MFSDVKVLDASRIRRIAPLVLDSAGELRVMPASFYDATTSDERAVFAVTTGLYGLPTLELVSWLTNAIAGRTALEIGAGTGVLSAALGIRATDNWMQTRPDIVEYYRAIGQQPVPYGKSVEKLDAAEAVAKYKPAVVIASWVTHRYDITNPAAGGNEFGVDEEALLRECETYIFIGNTKVHQLKPILRLPHQTFHLPWLYSRAHNGSPEYLKVWGKL